MPIVRLESLGTLTKEQKAQIAREFTETLRKVAGKPPEATYVVIGDVARENWAQGGVLFSEK